MPTSSRCTSATCARRSTTRSGVTPSKPSAAPVTASPLTAADQQDSAFSYQDLANLPGMNLDPYPAPRKAIVVVSASIGAGHDGAARELGRRLTADGFTVTHHDFLDMLTAGLGTALRGIYARQLRYAPASWGWLLRTAARPRGRAAASALAIAAATTRMLAAVAGQPAAVVSTYPLAGQVLGELRRTGWLTAPVLAMMTDPSVHPLCVSAGVDLHLAPNL